jgi:hypothetical protein
MTDHAVWETTASLPLKEWKSRIKAEKTSSLLDGIRAVARSYDR